MDALLDVFRTLTNLLTVVDERPRWCRHATYMGPHRCESMILGSITFCLTRAGLWPIPDEAGDVEHSILGLYETLSNLVIHDIGQPIRGEGDHAGCNPRDFDGPDEGGIDQDADTVAGIGSGPVGGAGKEITYAVRLSFGCNCC